MNKRNWLVRLKRNSRALQARRAYEHGRIMGLRTIELYTLGHDPEHKPAYHNDELLDAQVRRGWRDAPKAVLNKSTKEMRDQINKFLSESNYHEVV